MPDTTPITVVKRDSTKEPFSYDKLITSLLKTGVPMARAEELSKTVQTWSRSIAKTGEISSVMLRDKIIEVLNEDFPGESDSYQAFIKG